MSFRTSTLQALFEHLAGILDDVVLEGDGGLEIHGINGLREAGPGELSFLSNPRYGGDLAETSAGAVIVPHDALQPANGASLIRTGVPYLALASALSFLADTEALEAGVHPGAHVHPEAELAAGVTVMAGGYVGAGTVVGGGSVIYPGTVVMGRCRIGAEVLLYPGVVVREGCVLGDRVILHPNVCIGGDGFGFAQHEGRHIKIPQVGNVIIEDDVEIGACSCVDRATLGSTVIGRGSKIDDLVMIGHGGKVGAHTLIVAQSGMAGSAELEEGVVLGARAGVLGHLTVGAGSKLYSRAHVTKSLPPGSVVSGNPARPHAQQLKHEALLGKMEALMARVAELEREVAALKE